MAETPNKGNPPPTNPDTSPDSVASKSKADSKATAKELAAKERQEKTQAQIKAKAEQDEADRKDKQKKSLEKSEALKTPTQKAAETALLTEKSKAMADHKKKRIKQIEDLDEVVVCCLKPVNGQMVGSHLILPRKRAESKNLVGIVKLDPDATAKHKEAIAARIKDIEES